MPQDGDSVELLRTRVRQLETELEKRGDQIKRLERANQTMQTQLRDAQQSVQPTVEVTEMEEALKRLLTRMVMILQGSKCLFMIHDPQSGELFADTPAIGFEESDVKRMRFRVTEGISGEVFRENSPIILYDAETDDRTETEKWHEYGVRNGVCAPLIIEKRDEDTNAVLERRTIGVIWVFNKRMGNIFIDEDIQLLMRMARTAGSIINTAEYIRVIEKERDEAIETIRSLSMGLILVGRNQRITQINTSAMRMLGLKREDLTGGRTFDAVIKDEKVRELLQNALNEEAEISEEITLPDAENPEQTHTFQVQSANVRSESGDSIGVATIFNDITEIKNVDKMKSAFVSTVSHELRTPLTSIKGFTSTLLQDIEGYYDNETRHEFYTIINDECDRLRRLIDDLLNVSRIDAGKSLEMNIGEVNLRKAVSKVVTIQNGSTYKKPEHTITYEISDNLPEFIQADGDKVEQIFNNLISNALKYSPAGGEVKITGKMMSDELVEFAISDQGIGIPPEHLDRMFQRFHRVDNRDTRTVGGTGIGLFLTKALVEQHGGRIWLDSVYGKGTTFYFTLPTTQPEEAGDARLAQRVVA